MQISRAFTSWTRRRALTVAATACAACGIALVAWTSASSAEAKDDPRNFHGWLIDQFGEETRFLRTDHWRREVSRDSFSLQTNTEKRTFYGTFRAEEVSDLTDPSDPGKETIDGFEGWSVVQFGKERTYRIVDDWEGETNKDGFVLRRRGQVVWYYGTFQIYERLKR